VQKVLDRVFGQKNPIAGILRNTAQEVLDQPEKGHSANEMS